MPSDEISDTIMINADYHGYQSARMSQFTNTLMSGLFTRGVMQKFFICLLLLLSLLTTKVVADSLSVDPVQLREQVLSMSDPATLRSFLRKYDLVSENNVRTVLDDGSMGLIAPGDLGVDLFKKNLFGSAEEETILQVRFNQSLYSLSFFYKKDNKWQRVPGVVSINRDVPSNVPCLAKPDCPGYFCLDFEAGQAENEHLIVGRTFGGWCGSGSGRGNRFTILMWQVTQEGIHKLFESVFHELTYHSSRAATEGRVEKRIHFAESGESKFPKNVVVVEDHFDIPTGNGTIGEERKVGETWRVVELDYITP